MANFKVKTDGDIKKNRLLSIRGDKDGKETLIGYTENGGAPDFYSTGDLKDNSKLDVSVKNNLFWDVEASEDIPAGSGVTVGKDGTVIPTDSAGFGYVTKPVKAGDIAKVYRRSGGQQGPRGQKGQKGQDGAITEKQYNDLLKRLEDLEKKEGS